MHTRDCRTSHAASAWHPALPLTARHATLECPVCVPCTGCIFSKTLLSGHRLIASAFRMLPLQYPTVLHNGDVSLKDIYEVAKVMRPRSMARKMSGTVKEMLGTAQSVGCTVEGVSPHDIIEQIDSGETVIEVSTFFFPSEMLYAVHAHCAVLCLLD